MSTEGNKVFDLNKIKEDDHNKRVQQMVDEEQTKIKLVEIKLEQIETPDPNEIQLKKNFACLKCKNIPIAPVQ